LLTLIRVIHGGWEEAQAKEQILSYTSQLQDLRELVARNEVLSSLIRMDWAVRIDQNIQESQLRQILSNRAGPRLGERLYTHYTGTWARDGIKQYCNNDFFSGLDKWERGDIKVVDGEVMLEASKLDLMSGAINYIDKFGQLEVPLNLLGIRPFSSQHKLSEVLVSEYASIHGETEFVDGRETYIVDVQQPNLSTHFMRIWIDCERGMPLKLEHYNKSLTSNEIRLISEIKSIKLHHLPNGGWFPVEGTRVLHRRRPMSYMVFEYITVDVNSITIKREDIPDSLFTLEFPEGARVYNAITGLATEGGQVRNTKLESIIDESIEALDLDASPEIMSSSEQTKQEEKNSQQVPDKPPVPVNEPTLSENEKTTGALADVNPAALKGHSIVWILLPAFLAAFALTIIILMFRSPSRNIAKTDVK